ALKGLIVDFTGGITFTGHDGALDTRVTDPQIRFLDEDTAVLLVDFASNARDAAESGETDRETFDDLEFARLDLSAAEQADGAGSGGGDTRTWTDIPAVLTAQGASAFSTYSEGD